MVGAGGSFLSVEPCPLATLRLEALLKLLARHIPPLSVGPEEGAKVSSFGLLRLRASAQDGEPPPPTSPAAVEALPSCGARVDRHMLVAHQPSPLEGTPQAGVGSSLHSSHRRAVCDRLTEGGESGGAPPRAPKEGVDGAVEGASGVSLRRPPGHAAHEPREAAGERRSSPRLHVRDGLHRRRRRLRRPGGSPCGEAGSGGPLQRPRRPRPADACSGGPLQRPRRHWPADAREHARREGLEAGTRLLRHPPPPVAVAGGLGRWLISAGRRRRGPRRGWAPRLAVALGLCEGGAAAVNPPAGAEGLRRPLAGQRLPQDLARLPCRPGARRSHAPLAADAHDLCRILRRLGGGRSDHAWLPPAAQRRLRRLAGRPRRLVPQKLVHVVRVRAAAGREAL